MPSRHPFGFEGRAVQEDKFGNLAIHSSGNNDGNLTVDGAATVTGALTATGGVNTASGNAVIAAPGFSSGTAAQLSDLTRDYMVYVVIGTGGGTVTIAIGPTSGVANTIVSAAVGVAGTLMAVRLPAGWFYKITLVTSTIASQIAVSA